MIHGNDVREALELSNDACIDFAILVGTDFSRRIRNCGPMRALKLIKEYETIENILNSQTKYQPAESRAQYMAQVNSARAIFSSLPPIPSQLRLAAMSTGLVNQAKVAVVMERCGLGRALVADSLWDYEAALDGNYFSDNPSMIVS
jgi:flap endonuclease-1